MARLRARFVALALLVASLGLLSLPQAAHACSICRCGDPTFNALGKEGFTTSGFRLALDWERFDKDEGDPTEESESLVENRFTALVSYGFSERFMLLARVPLSARHLQASVPDEEPETVRTRGLSDPEIYGQVACGPRPLRRASAAARRSRSSPVSRHPGAGTTCRRRACAWTSMPSPEPAPRTCSGAWPSST